MASNTIKGLTVEIGGDTTGLGKALEAVNKKGRDLSTELGQINRLLKFDPSNAELLTQKQKVLAEAVSTTREKLDKMREAEKQLKESGKASEAQMRELRREIIATEKKLGGYERAAEETAEALDKLGDESDGVKDGAKDIDKGADKAADSLDDLADSADDAGEAGEGMGSKLANAAKTGLTMLTTACTAVLGAMVGSAEASREYRTEMGKLDTAFKTEGHRAEDATKTYKALQGVLGETEQAVEASNHLAKLCDNEKELADWTKIATGVYATFGASLPIEGLTEAANETAKTGALTGGLADALNWAGVNEDDFQAKLDACTSEQERQALITETLTGLYTEAADAYRETNAEIIRANEANEAWAASMAEAGGAIEPILTDVKLLGASLLSDLLPGVKGVAEGFRGIFSGEEGAADAIGASLSGLITDVLNKVTELAPTAARVAISLITTLATSLLGQLPTLTRTCMQLIEQAINSIPGALPVLLSSLVDSAFGILTNFAAYLPDAISAFMSFIASLASEIPSLASQIAEWVPELVDTCILALQLCLPQILQGVIQLLMALTQAAPILTKAILPLVPEIISAVLSSIADNLPMVLDGILDLVVLLVTQVLPAVTAEIIKCTPQILAAVLRGCGQIVASLVSWAGSLLVRIGSWLTGIGERIGEWFAGVWTKFTAWLSNIWGTFIDWITALPKKAREGAENFLKNVVEFFDQLPHKIGYALGYTLAAIANWAVNTATKAKEMGTQFVNNVVTFFKELPGKVQNWLTSTIEKVKNWAVNMATKAKETGSNFISNTVSFFKQLPSNIWTWLKNAVTKVTEFGTNAVSKAKTAAQNIKDTIVNGIKELPNTLKNIGTNLVQGLWNGITNAKDWLLGKIKSFTSGVLDGIKGFFGVHSPAESRGALKTTDWIGEMLDEGLAVGVTKNVKTPVKAMKKVTEDVLSAAQEVDGLQLERNLQYNVAESRAAAASGLGAKLDKILAAIERGQIITIDRKHLIGATADGYDAALGLRRDLIARGAL